MLLSRTTRTLFTGVGTGVLDDRQCAAGAGAGAARRARHRLRSSSRTEFETSTRRHIAEGGLRVSATSDALTVNANVRHTNREGTIPFGGSFGHSSLVEIPAPTEHDLTEVEAGAEYARDAAAAARRLHRLVVPQRRHVGDFDNPFRRDRQRARRRRGGGSPLAPSNSFIGVNGLASVKLPLPLPRERVRARSAR